MIRTATPATSITSIKQLEDPSLQQGLAKLSPETGNGVQQLHAEGQHAPTSAICFASYSALAFR